MPCQICVGESLSTKLQKLLQYVSLRVEVADTMKIEFRCYSGDYTTAV